MDHRQAVRDPQHELDHRTRPRPMDLLDLIEPKDVLADAGHGWPEHQHAILQRQLALRALLAGQGVNHPDRADLPDHVDERSARPECGRP